MIYDSEELVDVNAFLAELKEQFKAMGMDDVYHIIPITLNHHVFKEVNNEQSN